MSVPDNQQMLVGVLETEGPQTVFLVLKPAPSTTITRHFEIDFEVRVTSSAFEEESDLQHHHFSLFLTGYSENKAKATITVDQAERIKKALLSGIEPNLLSDELKGDAVEDTEEDLVVEGKYVLHLLSHTHVAETFKQTRSTTKALKVMSYNIWNYNANWPSRVQAIANEVKKHNPDIISWQELRASLSDGDIDTSKPSQIQDLAALLPQYQYVWQPAMHYNFAQKTEGTGIMSRYPIVETSYVSLSQTEGSSDLNQRICLHANILFPGNRHIHFFVAHFSYDPIGQMSNAIESAHFIREVETSSLEREIKPAATFFVGDFNMGSSHEEPLDFLTGKKTVGGQREKFRDLWKELKGSESGLTFSNLDSFIDRPDRILYRGEGVKGQQVELGGYAYEKEDGSTMIPSDHLAVVGDFLLSDSVVS